MSETTQIETPPEKGTPEYNEAMAEKYDKGFRTDDKKQSFEAPKEIAAIPETGLEKFYNKESGEYDWPNHAKELQYRLDQQKKESQPADGPEADTQKIDWETITKSVAENKTLNEAEMKQLMEFGIPEEIVNSYVDLMGVSQEFAQQRTIEYAGGEENLNAIFDWASKNLPEEEVKNYNAILDSPNWRMALDSLRISSGIGVETMAANKNNPQLVEGSNTPTSSAGFAAKQEMIEAMGNPKYKSDPAFRHQVRLRVAQSNF